MPDRGDEGGNRRRRRTPEVAQREIIDAAEALLRERPFRELTVDEVMRRTGLSRPSFYVYFKDRHDLMLRVFAALRGELQTVVNRWTQADGNSPQRLREALEGVVAVYAQHGPVVRALADAATDDPEVEQAYTGVVQFFIDAARERITSEVKAGVIAKVDPEETAKALVWMTERYLYHSLGTARPSPPDEVAATLISVMSRALYQSS